MGRSHDTRVAGVNRSQAILQFIQLIRQMFRFIAISFKYIAIMVIFIAMFKLSERLIIIHTGKYIEELVWRRKDKKWAVLIVIIIITGFGKNTNQQGTGVTSSML